MTGTGAGENTAEDGTTGHADSAGNPRPAARTGHGDAPLRPPGHDTTKPPDHRPGPPAGTTNATPDATAPDAPGAEIGGKPVTGDTADGRPDSAPAAGPDPVTEAADSADAAEPGAGTGALPSADDVAERRLHPVTPLRRAWAPVAVLVGWAVHDPDQAQRQLTRLTTTHLLIGLAVLIPAAALYGFLTWWFTHYAVTDTELRIRTGLLFRRTAHIRLERIQAIDVTQPLLARVAGVAKLKLDVIGTGKKRRTGLPGRRRGERAAGRAARARGGPCAARDGTPGR
ncbi:hypothetical protein SVIOM342S_01285 [Streptomyces violaceorubidus]